MVIVVENTWHLSRVCDVALSVVMKSSIGLLGWTYILKCMSEEKKSVLTLWDTGYSLVQLSLSTFLQDLFYFWARCPTNVFFFVLRLEDTQIHTCIHGIYVIEGNFQTKDVLPDGLVFLMNVFVLCLVVHIHCSKIRKKYNFSGSTVNSW